MTMKILHLFPDTNVFVQCRALHELDWSGYAKYDEVHLVVCTPVQREIDQHKTRGNDRIGKKSRKVYSMLRELLVSGDDYKVIQDREPIVKLLLDPSCKPDQTLAGRLDYDQMDDRIVGCVYAYRKTNQQWDIRLLTHDGGPMATAQMLDIPFVPVPDNWLLPPEPTGAERENRRLREEIARLKDAEPNFSISHSDGDGKEIERLELEWPLYEELSVDEIGSLMRLLKRTFPVATDFGASETKWEQPRTARAVTFDAMRRFEPPSQQEIERYTSTAYPEWIEQCENLLRRLHDSLERNREPVAFSFAAVNEGSRPGKHVLVTITARGNFLVRPPRESDDGEEEKDTENSAQGLLLPPPPRPPKGKWTRGYGSPLFRNLGSMVGTARVISDPFNLAMARHVESLTLRRDPNAFYYKPNRSREPLQSFSLECEQWRHGMAAEVFEGELWVEPDTPEVRGALEFEIHAENLHRPAKMTVQVRGRVKPFDVNEFAQGMIRLAAKRE